MVVDVHGQPHTISRWDKLTVEMRGRAEGAMVEESVDDLVQACDGPVPDRFDIPDQGHPCVLRDASARLLLDRERPTNEARSGGSSSWLGAAALTTGVVVGVAAGACVIECHDGTAKTVSEVGLGVAGAALVGFFVWLLTPPPGQVKRVCHADPKHARDCSSGDAT